MSLTLSDASARGLSRPRYAENIEEVSRARWTRADLIIRHSRDRRDLPLPAAAALAYVKIFTTVPLLFPGRRKADDEVSEHDYEAAAYCRLAICLIPQREVIA